MTLWGVFKDLRGVAYCEPVNQGIMVFTKIIPAQSAKRHRVTRRTIHPAREQEVHYHIKFDEDFYSREEYMASSFMEPPEGYNLDPNTRYLEENRWGPVKILVFIKDDNLGRRMQYEFRRISPEHELYDLGKKRDLLAEPHPETDRIISGLKSLSHEAQTQIQ